ncbi:MFS transporter [Aestuariimicrobium ganziense]|uniref:MFS transporter n=1 Tax=Aestuariimicrobium ganziense TaxID=2773677 RepID=UPI0019413D20|nr:MFS transporter [Aestuariimicrobium ganziense]
MPSTPAKTASRALTVGILMGVFAVAFQAYAVATAMPRAAEDLGQLGLFAWTFSMFVIGIALSTVLGGRAVDRFGPVIPSALGLALFTVGLVVAGSAPTMLVLVTGRFVQGLGGGLINVALMVIVARAYAEHRRAVMMTAFSFCWVLPAFIGPPVAALVTRLWSWHAAFWILVPVMVLTAILCWRPMLAIQRQGVPQHDEPVDPVPVWAAIAAALGLAVLQAGTERLDLLGAGMAVAGLAALGLAVPRMMPPGFFTVAAGIPAVSWTRLLQAGSFFTFESFLPLALVQTRGLSLFWAGSMLTIGSVGWTTGSWLQSRPWLRIRRDQIIVLGTLCGVVGLVGVAAGVLVPSTAGLVVIATAYSIAGLGMGFSTASGSLAVMQLSSHARLGRNTSSLQVSETMGNALSLGLAGAIFVALRETHIPTTTFAWLFAAICLVAVAAYLAARRIGPVRNATSGVG